MILFLICDSYWVFQSGLYVEKQDKLVNRLNVHPWYFGRGYINKVYMLACLKLSANMFLYVNTKYGIANFEHRRASTVRL